MIDIVRTVIILILVVWVIGFGTGAIAYLGCQAYKKVKSKYFDYLDED